MSDTSWRFYEVEKRVEELEAVVIKQRRFMILIDAYLLTLSIVVLMAVI